eukprot:8615532-Alexandrium_andersonii.AAC.1
MCIRDRRPRFAEGAPLRPPPPLAAPPPAAACIPAAEVPEVNHKVKFAGQHKSLYIAVAAPAAELYICSESDVDVSLPVGTLVAGFYSGKRFCYKPDGGEELGPEKDVPFELTDANSR